MIWKGCSFSGAAFFLLLTIDLSAKAKEVDCLLKSMSAADTGQIYRLAADNEVFLASAEKGLFALTANKDDSLTARKISTKNLIVSFVKVFSKKWYVASNNGLYRYDPANDDLLQIKSSISTGLVRDISLFGGELFIASENGLFKLDGTELKLVKDGDASRFGRLNGQIIVAIDGELFELSGGEWSTLGLRFPQVYVIESHPQLRDTLIIGSERGIYFAQKNNDKFVKTPLNQMTPPLGLVLKISVKASEILAATRTGVFSIETATIDQPKAHRLPSLRFNHPTKPTSFDTQLVYDLYEQPGMTFAASDQGLFIINRNSLRLVSTNSYTGPIFQVFQYGNRIFVPSREGISEYIQSSLKEGSLERTDNKSLIVGRAGDAIRVSLDLGRCTSASSSLGLAWRLSSTSAKEGYLRFVEFRGDRAIFDIPFEGMQFQSAEDLDVIVTTISSTADELALGRVKVTAGLDWAQLTAFGAAFAGLGAFIFHFAFFTFLLILSPYNKWCFELLFDSRIGQGRLYFNEIIGRLRYLQIYVFQSAYKTQRENWYSSYDQAYYSVPVIDQNGAVIQSVDLLSSLKHRKRIALLGAAGRGKSSVILKCAAIYFEEATLSLAWRRHGFYLLPVRLRYIRRIDARDRAWIARVVQITLAESGWAIEDLSLIDRLIRSGFFGFALDGISETDREQDVLIVSKELPHLNIMYTSRGGAVSGFCSYALPSNLSDFASGIIAAHFGDGVAAAVIQQTPADFLQSMKSGFELSLLAKVFVLTNDVPRRRLQVYEALLDQAVSSGLGESLDRTLSRCAWDLWQRDERNITSFNIFSPDEINIFAECNIAQARGGSFVEFSHDQMRGYFAARWLAFHLGHVTLIHAMLQSEGVWKPAPAVQTEMFLFFSEMLMAQCLKEELSVADLKGIAQFSVEDGKRFVLQKELSRAANSYGLAIEVQLGMTVDTVLSSLDQSQT